MLKTNTKKFFLHIKKTTFTFFLCIATTTVLADTISNIRANNKVVIGYRESSIPFSYLDQNKKTDWLCHWFVSQNNRRN